MRRDAPPTAAADTSPVDLAVVEALLLPQQRQPKVDSIDGLVTVTDLAQELGISARTLRFYEDKGLIAPRRIGAARVYSQRERARMILILRGKELGFSLREIKSYLDLYDADPKHEMQTLLLLSKIAERRHQLEQKSRAIVQALQGLDDLEQEARASLSRIAAREKKPRARPHAD